MKDYIWKATVVFGGICFGMLEVLTKVVLWAIVLPGIALNLIGAKLFKTKSYLIQLLAIPALSTIVAAEILGNVGREAVEYAMSKSGYDITYEELKKLILEAIRG